VHKRRSSRRLGAKSFIAAHLAGEATSSSSTCVASARDDQRRYRVNWQLCGSCSPGTSGDQGRRRWRDCQQTRSWEGPDTAAAGPEDWLQPFDFGLSSVSRQLTRLALGNLRSERPDYLVNLTVAEIIAGNRVLRPRSLAAVTAGQASIAAERPHWNAANRC
jgi:hypothetical protein